MTARNIVKTFDGVLNCFVSGKEYKKRPPQGPPQELPVLTDEELRALQMTLWGEDLSSTGYAYDQIRLVETPAPVEVCLPELDDLKNVNVCGIDGSNQRVERSSFYFLMARAAIVEFRYSTYSGPRCQDSRSRKIRKLFQHQTKPSMRAMDFVYPVRWSVAVVVGGGGSVVNSAVGSCPQFPRPAPPS